VRTDSTFLIDDDNNYMIIKNVEKKVFLLNPVKYMPEEFNNHIVNVLNALKNKLRTDHLKSLKLMK
jgi:hypothetical protein